MLWLTDESELDLKTGLSVAYFYSHRDPYHFQVFNHLETIESEFPTIKFYAIEAESFPKLVKQHSVSSVPFLRIFRDEGYTVRSFTKLDDILNKAILTDIDTRYTKGELRGRGRSGSGRGNKEPETVSGTATTIRTDDSGQDLGGYSESRSSDV